MEGKLSLSFILSECRQGTGPARPPTRLTHSLPPLPAFALPHSFLFLVTVQKSRIPRIPSSVSLLPSLFLPPLSSSSSASKRVSLINRSSHLLLLLFPPSLPPSLLSERPLKRAIIPRGIQIHGVVDLGAHFLDALGAQVSLFTLEKEEGREGGREGGTEGW